MIRLKYEFNRIERKWQDRWAKENCYHAETGGDKPKFYALVEFPYPSGQGLHVGHARPYTAMDVVAEKAADGRLQCASPWAMTPSACPRENYAIKNHIHPAKVTHDNIANFTKQLHMLGYSLTGTGWWIPPTPKYYKWTQWTFPPAVQEGPGIQDLHARQLVHLL